MKLASLEEIVRVMDEAEVRFLVVGGLAVVAHGYGRFTHDVDFVIELQPQNVERAFAALGSIGYRPRVPVTASGFADPRQRKEWIDQKGMTVLTLHSDLHRDTPVDLFVTEPFDFDEEFANALLDELAPGRSMRIVRLKTLLKLKRESGRPQDLVDIHELQILHGKNDE